MLNPQTSSLSCLHCQADLLPTAPRPGPPAKYCSTKCGNAVRNQRQREQNPDSVRARGQRYLAKNPEARAATVAKHATPENKAAHLSYGRQTYWADVELSRKNANAARVANYEQHALTAVKSRSRKKGVPCDLELSDVQVPAVCSVLGIPLFKDRGLCDNSPSVDQLVPGAGYMKGNVRVISNRANRLKSNATLAELALVVADLEGAEPAAPFVLDPGSDLRRMLSNARQRAQRKGLTFDLELADLKAPIHCPVLGLLLASSRETHSACSPSLDRIDPAQGYVRGNVRIVSYRANMLKNNATAAEMRLVLGDAQNLAAQVPLGRFSFCCVFLQQKNNWGCLYDSPHQQTWSIT